MEWISKLVKGVFFNDEEVDLKAATKLKYIVYGVILALAVEVVCVFIMPDEETTEISE